MTGTLRSRVDGAVGIATIDRPAKLNALDAATLAALAEQLEAWDADPAIRAIVVLGGERAFAAGADVGALADAAPIELFGSGFSASWDRVAAIRTPVVAGARGYALGGGLELALACDILIVGDDAQLGLPETGIGTVPGAGGTQRLVRAVGKSLAMELVLAGRRIGADEAVAAGLASTVVPSDRVEDAAVDLAQRIAERAPVAVRMAKELILDSFESPLASGIRKERAASSLLASTRDHHEGMDAFREKRPPRYEGR
jgi:enoyl-CoA hydratase